MLKGNFLFSALISIIAILSCGTSIWGLHCTSTHRWDAGSRKKERDLSLHMCLYLYICIYLFQEQQCILSPPNGSSVAHVKQAERAKVPKYVGQKNWSVLNLNSNQTLMVPGTELPIPCARTWNVRSEYFQVPSSSGHLGWRQSVDLWSGSIWKKWLGFF